MPDSPWLPWLHDPTDIDVGDAVTRWRYGMPQTDVDKHALELRDIPGQPAVTGDPESVRQARRYAAGYYFAKQHPVLSKGGVVQNLIDVPHTYGVNNVLKAA